MMTKINNTLSEIKSMSKTMPKTIMEAIDFERDMDRGYDDAEMDNSPEMEPDMPEKEESMDISQFIDDIRKKARKGMAQLADNPDDPNYECLKRIWQVCDKAYSDQKNGMSGQQPQQMQRPAQR